MDSEYDFDLFLKDVVAGDALFGATEDIVTAITEAMKQKFITPPMEALQMTLANFELTVEEARRIMFFPTVEDAAKYPLMISGPLEGAPDNHPGHKLQRFTIVTMYLRHTAKWDFVEAFILAGGLNVLAELAVHPDLHVRSQAVGSFLFITTEEHFAWHPLERDPTQSAGASSASSAQGGAGPERAEELAARESEKHDKQLRFFMFQLTRTDLVKNLLANRSGSWPKGSYECLRAFAFFCSFVRHNFCRSRVLHLGEEILDILKNWPESDFAEERSLAQQLYNDFSRFGSAENPLQGAGARGKEVKSLGSVVEDEGETEDDTPVKLDFTPQSKGHEGGSKPDPSMQSPAIKEAEINDSSQPETASAPEHKVSAEDNSRNSTSGQDNNVSCSAENGSNSQVKACVVDTQNGCLEVQIQGLQSSAGVAAEVVGNGELLEIIYSEGSNQEHTLKVDLPSKVDPDSCKAKFSKKTKQLTIKMKALQF